MHMKTALLIFAVVVLALVAIAAIVYLVHVVYRKWIKKQEQIAEQEAEREKERLERIEAEARRKEEAQRILLSKDSGYTKMLIVSCYAERQDLGTSINEDNLRLVHVCNEIDTPLSSIDFDWVVYYEPRKNPYTTQTLSAIRSHPENKTLRLSCGCYRESARREDYRNPNGGRNSYCGSNSNRDIRQVARCWLRKSTDIDCDGGNSHNLKKDLARLNFAD